MNAKYRNVRTLVAAACLGVFSGQTAATTVISELFYDATGPDAGRVFIELFGMPGQVLDGWSLEAMNGSGGLVYKRLALSGSIPDDGVFVIGDDAAGTTTVANADVIADVDLQNGPDSLLLKRGDVLVDAVGYGDFAAGDVFLGEVQPAPATGSGKSLARLDPKRDTDNNKFDFIVLDMPTPGVVPTVGSVPLPASVWLLVSGLGTMLVGRLRRPVADG